ncbi:diacylglycerol kinase [Candidatus Uhrbacteria bacterium]|nr:diacylglycerol kinase [Candidatus Uhrbacteria bacterium]
MTRFSRFIRSLRHALRGVRVVFRSEQSFRLQCVFATLAVLLLLILPVSGFQAVVILLLIGLVLVLEMVNSVLERLVDALKPRMHPVVGDIKDIMAAAVLFASLTACVIGAVVFLPHLFALFVA